MPKAPPIASDYLASIVRMVRRAGRYWWVAVSAFFLTIAITLVVAETRGKEYRSEAVVYYQEGMQWTPTEGMSTRRIGQRLKDSLLARAQLAKLIEEIALYPKLTAAGKMSEAVEEMRVATTFRVNEGDVFVLSFTGTSPEQAQRVTARLTEVLIGENTRLRQEQAEVARAFLDAEKKRNEADLSGKETAVVRFLAKHPEFAQEQTTFGVALRATKKGTDLPRDHYDTLAALRREEDRLKRQLANPGQLPRGPADPALLMAKNEAEAKLRAAQRELSDRRARFTEQHPDVRSAAALVKDAEDAYRRAADAAAASARAAAIVEVEPRAALEARLQQVQQEIAAYQRKQPKEQAAPADPGETSDAAQRIVALETEWARLNREVNEARDRFQALDSKQFMASMTATTLMSGQAAQITVIDPAFVPAQPIGMSTKRLLLMGIVLALVLGVGLAVLCALVDDRVYDPADLERLEIAPVLVDISRESMQRQRADL